MAGHGNVIVVMPYNFSIPQFVSDEVYAADTSRDTSSTMILERMQMLERKVDEKNTSMMSMLQSTCSKMNTPAPAAQPSFTQTYARAASPSTMRMHQGRPQHLNIPGGVQGRDRSPSVKRGNSETNQPEKKRRIEKQQIVTGTRSNTTRKMKSPPADIFVYGIPRDTTKEDIVEDLAESEIQIIPGDIQLMSKGNPTVVSYRISVKAEDLSKALDPTVWPLRVKVREFIYYKRRTEQRNQETVRRNTHTEQLSGSAQSTAVGENRMNGTNSVNSGRFHVLENDVQA